jgi:hypothetical protein
MKINEVPQDDAGFLKAGKVRDVCYATDEEGKYTQILSVGWNPKNEAIRQAWDQIHLKAEKIRQQVLCGKLSPLAFHMERCMMSSSLLSQYTGFSRLKIWKDKRPKAFKMLSQQELMAYAEALNMDENTLNLV